MDGICPCTGLATCAVRDIALRSGFLERCRQSHVGAMACLALGWWTEGGPEDARSPRPPLESRAVEYA